LPPGTSRKMSPKYIGPFLITQEMVPGAPYCLDLTPDLVARRINPVFHASLLRICWENEDSCFPGRQLHKITGFRSHAKTWAVREITEHYGKGCELLFEVKWSTGHIT
ncbi:hypothetical protein EXIGLDRAFT_616590, partial [Exidia glandulosa HHB12029]